jgi:hypothetical protein
MSYTLAFIAVLAFVYVKFMRASRLRLPLPPGPKRMPIIGNMRDVGYNGVHPWITYTEWAATYGDVIYLEGISESVVVLNSMKAVTELLEKRSANYSDKPGETSIVSRISIGN